MRILPSAVIREAEAAAFARGDTTPGELMDRVIRRLHMALHPLPLPQGTPRCIVVYAGKGNNAGDAIGLAARYGCPVVLRSPHALPELSPETRRQYALLRQAEFSLAPPEPRKGLLIIDGLLGSGAKGTLRPEYAALVQELNTLRQASPGSCTLSIDIPTGLQADSGEPAPSTVRADLTAAIGCVKPGMLTDGAETYVGKLLCIPLPEINLPSSDAAQVADEQTLRWLPQRPYTCYKNQAGRVGIVAGSMGYLGAAQMCTEAALQAGAGLVTLYCPRDIYPLLAPRIAPEAMVRPIDSYADIPREKADAFAIGPGLGAPGEEEQKALAALIRELPCPMVLDADALNLISSHAWDIPPHAILTPHPGEMRRLFPEAARLTRPETIRRFLAAHPCTLLLKGARSIISDGGSTWYNSEGGPYMANGGQGDLLAGVIAALAAQGVPALQAATLGAYLCGKAAYLAWTDAHCPPGIRATQAIRQIQRAFT